MKKNSCLLKICFSKILYSVTPSSKVVGDLAQFMVHNNLTADDVRSTAKDLSFPNSVIDMMQGGLGIPVGGFPEPLRSDIVGSLPTIHGRPGESMEPIDFGKIENELVAKYKDLNISAEDVMSYAMYPGNKLAIFAIKNGFAIFLPKNLRSCYF